MTGEVLSRLTADTTLVLSVIGSSVSVALRNVAHLVGGLGAALLHQPEAHALVLVGVPLVLAPILVLGRRLRALSRESQDRIADVERRRLRDPARGADGAGLHPRGREPRQLRRPRRAGFDAAVRRTKTRALLTAIVIFLVFAAIVAVLWIGARDVLAGTMTAGELVQFVLYSVMVAGAAGALSEIWGELQRAAGATERMVELLRRPDPIAPAAPAAAAGAGRAAPSLRRRDLPLSGAPGDAGPARLHLAIAPGETVALVGPSGAGKTTMFQLLLRFYDPEAGRDPPRRRRHRASRPAATCAAQIALVPQEPVIFATTARENIRYGRPEATDAEVEAAARAAAADGSSRELPQGYDTFLGERGMRLSGGQRQRIAIARAILRDPPVLLLDEATSALDAESERAVQQALEALAPAAPRSSSPTGSRP